MRHSTFSPAPPSTPIGYSGRILRFAGLVAGTLLAYLGAAAATQEILPEFHIRHSTFSVVSENDKYFAGTDRHYTNGFKFAWIGETDLNQS